MSVRQDDCRWLYRLEPTTPIGAAINQDAGISLSHEQRAVEPMPTRPFPNIAPGAKEVELHAKSASPKLCQPWMIWIKAPGAHSLSAQLANRKTRSARGVVEAISQRRSVRAFTTDQVAPEFAGRLESAAVQAPSAMNLQPWAFAIIEGRAALQSYSERPSGTFSTRCNTIRGSFSIETNFPIRPSISFTGHLC
jgi:hypothetical protein